MPELPRRFCLRLSLAAAAARSHRRQAYGRVCKTHCQAKTGCGPLTIFGARARLPQVVRRLLRLVGAPPPARSFEYQRLRIALCALTGGITASQTLLQPGQYLEGAMAVGGFVKVTGEDQLVGLGLFQQHIQSRANL